MSVLERALLNVLPSKFTDLCETCATRGRLVRRLRCDHHEERVAIASVVRDRR